MVKNKTKMSGEDDDDNDDDGDDDDQFLHTEQGWQARCEYLWQSRYRDPEEK